MTGRPPTAGGIPQSPAVAAPRGRAVARFTRRHSPSPTPPKRRALPSRNELTMSDSDKNTVYLHDLVRDDIVARMRDAAESAGQKADTAALRRAVEAEMSGFGNGRRPH